MNGRAITPAMLTGLILVVILLLLLYHPGGDRTANGPGSGVTVSLLYASTGSMAQLLSTGQIDAFIVWESVVSTSVLSGTGKMIATSADMPPPGEWADAACCVLVLRNDLIE
jgi:ABC-type nitrate/sulfonate/bicarbonate transport system substrate-binding protein